MRLAAAFLVLIIGAAVTTLAMEGARGTGSRFGVTDFGTFAAMLAGLVLTAMALGFVFASAMIASQP